LTPPCRLLHTFSTYSATPAHTPRSLTQVYSLFVKCTYPSARELLLYRSRSGTTSCFLVRLVAKHTPQGASQLVKTEKKVRR
jgi:hypothetical protein